jgi:hypothetical protein
LTKLHTFVKWVNSQFCSGVCYMQIMPIDATRNARLAVVLPHEMVEEIDAYRVARRATLGRIPSQSAALAELIQKGLERWREERAEPKGRKP